MFPFAGVPAGQMEILAHCATATITRDRILSCFLIVTLYVLMGNSVPRGADFFITHPKTWSTSLPWIKPIFFTSLADHVPEAPEDLR